MFPLKKYFGLNFINFYYSFFLTIFTFLIFFKKHYLQTKKIINIKVIYNGSQVIMVHNNETDDVTCEHNRELPIRMRELITS
jgi:hypothetical protein